MRVVVDFLIFITCLHVFLDAAMDRFLQNAYLLFHHQISLMKVKIAVILCLKYYFRLENIVL